MRPVNLIPPEERAGERTAARTGPAPYLIVAVLAVALGAVTMVVLTNHKISDRKSEIVTLQAEEASATAEADRMSAFAEFATMTQTRRQTVSALARSRFDWHRVLRELAIVIPSDVWLTSVDGSVSPGGAPGAASGSGTSLSGSDLSSGVSGPSLTIQGCGASHEAVGRFAAALEDIDGVTRVGVAKSERSEQTQAAVAAGGTDCRTRDFIAEFSITVAFDSVQLDAGSVPAVPPAPADGGGVADAQAQEQQARDSTHDQVDRGHESVGLVSGTIR